MDKYRTKNMTTQKEYHNIQLKNTTLTYLLERKPVKNINLRIKSDGSVCVSANNRVPRIILWTCRCGRKLEQAVQWCEEFGLEFDKVNRNTDEILEKYGSDSRKIYADVYIDDKACFPWEVMAYKKEE